MTQIKSFADLAKIIGAPPRRSASYRPGFRCRVRKALSSIGYYLWVGLLLWFVGGSIIGWFVDLPALLERPRASRAGQDTGGRELDRRSTDHSCEAE